MPAGRCALVTGSSGGIGRAIGEALARAGCDVVLHGLEPETGMAATCEEIGARGRGRVTYIRRDVSTGEGAAALFAEAERFGGGPDILVNNAVVRHFAPIEAFPPAEWERALAVNLSAAFHLVRLALPGMRSRGWGRIVNMSSIYGRRGAQNRVDYVTTKTALIGFTRAVAAETFGQGITCNALCPGSVLTPAHERRIGDAMRETDVGRAEAESAFLAGKQPGGRFIAADDVASLVLFLCHDAARDITGAELPVDAGWGAA